MFIMAVKHKVHQGHVEIQISDLQAEVDAVEVQNDLPVSNGVPPLTMWIFQDFFQQSNLEDSTLVVVLLSLLLIWLVTIVYVGYRTQKWWMGQEKARSNALEMVEKHQQHAITMNERLFELDSMNKEAAIAHRKEIDLLREQLSESMQMNARWTASHAGTWLPYLLILTLTLAAPDTSTSLTKT